MRYKEKNSYVTKKRGFNTKNTEELIFKIEFCNARKINLVNQCEIK